jgi:hypothetical protein
VASFKQGYPILDLRNSHDIPPSIATTIYCGSDFAEQNGPFLALTPSDDIIKSRIKCNILNFKLIKARKPYC